MIFHIDDRDAGRTVLSFLRSKLRISSTALAALKRDECGIMANGVHVTVRYVLAENDVLFVNEKDSFEHISENIEPVPLPLSILFENDDILVANKPADMPTHPSHGHTDDTLANAVAYLYRERGLPFIFRPIGRLDRNTSGISLMAKHNIAASFLFYARQKEMIHKKYIAILDGRLESGQDYQTIRTYMRRQENSVILRCVGSADEEGSFSAVTRWRTLFSCDQCTVVEAIPITGRTHQLRVHFAHLGHPILGDDIYGSVSPYIGRHALHAAFLAFPLPYGDEESIFLSPPPEDMVRALTDCCGYDLNKIYREGFEQYEKQEQ